MKTLFFFGLFVSLLFVSPAVAQQKNDSTKAPSATRKALQKGIALFSTTPADTIGNEMSSSSFQEFENKRIRKINIEFIDLDRSVYDSSKRVSGTIRRIANSLHTGTKEKIIRNHLFIAQNKPLNPYLLADNERYLRDLEFILDARIIVTPVVATDEVDVTVITRDVFSIGASVGGSPAAAEFSMYDANLLGGGQRLQFSGVQDASRNPGFGYSMLIRKSSVGGTLANVEAAYTQLNTGIGLGTENESAFYLRVNRPLVSPYSRLAGGLEASSNWSTNVFNKPDSSFLSYRYRLIDTWVGYNIGLGKDFANRNRHFFSVRYFTNNFSERPFQRGFNQLINYNNSDGWLGELTFYRKNFFKTRYVLGFGRTEDISQGLSLAVSTGYLTFLQLERPYAAAKFNYSNATKTGNFYSLKLESGGFARNGLEDFLLRAEATFVTKANNLHRYKIRSFFTGGYTELFNRATTYLSTNDQQVFGFVADSLLATRQIYGRVEAVVYTPWLLAGFRFAPFAALDVLQTECAICKSKNPMIVGINAGLRTRNENLIFGTVEIRGTYIPNDGTGNSQFKITFRQNLRIKNSANFIAAPAIISY